ncbi:hypothetical protein TNCV_2102031 [Trichonephila clavipes]|nr:hypothetical protein TNCV_2102031 [Trichonephila clavipes]
MLSHDDYRTLPAALDYAAENPWCELPDRDGSTDSRLGLSQAIVFLLKKHNVHIGGHGVQGKMRTSTDPSYLPQ